MKVFFFKYTLEAKPIDIVWRYETDERKINSGKVHSALTTPSSKVNLVLILFKITFGHAVKKILLCPKHNFLLSPIHSPKQGGGLLPLSF